MIYKILGTFFSMLLFQQIVVAQENPHILPQHDFIQYDSNYLHFYHADANLDNFYAKLDTLMFSYSGGYLVRPTKKEFS